MITPAGSAVQPAWHSVAERINDFERSQDAAPKFAYLEPSKTHRLSNPALKALQKNAVQSYVERQQQQQQQAHKEEQQLLRPGHSYQSLQAERKSLPNNLSPISSSSGSGCSSPTPPPPPPRSRSLLPNLLRRSSSASDYAEFREQQQHSQHSQHSREQHSWEQQQQFLLQQQHSREQHHQPSIRNISSAEKSSFNDIGMPPPPPPPRGRVALPSRRTSSATEYAPMREKLLLQQAAALAHQQHHPQQHRVHNLPLGPAERPPERPPKHPHLRVPSPELPPPPMTLAVELDTSYTFDEPLPPPPPPEVLQPRPPASPNRRNSFAGASTRSRATPTPKLPPQVPKKPTSLRQQVPPHLPPLCPSLFLCATNCLLPRSLPQLPHKPQAALANGATNSNLPTNTSNSRKRPHIPESGTASVVASAPTAVAATQPPPPPLLPRARPTHVVDSVIASNLNANLESNQQLKLR